jgi:ceramide glucosyltransferase
MMTAAIWALGVFCSVAALAHLASIAFAINRCRSREPTPRCLAPAVSVVRPLCGLDHHANATLTSTFRLDHPRYEVVFCVARRDDPAAALALTTIERFPTARARLLIGDERISANPKLNNIAKGWQASAYDWIVLADSNVLMPPDALARLLGAWREGTGLVCSPPIGSDPANLWAELECAFLNSYQARWQYAADTLGLGFAQGKTMLWRRDFLEQAGGIAALAAESAEDAAATKLVRRAGLRVRLVDGPFSQPLGRRTFGEVWARQLRWARLRRATFKGYFAAEILSGGLPPTAALGVLAILLDWPLAPVLAAFVAAWYGTETLLCFAAGWTLSRRSPWLAMLRDGLLPVLWTAAWLGSDFVWRGNRMRAFDTSAATLAEPLKS